MPPVPQACRSRGGARPKGGRRTCRKPPGLLADYPELRETPSPEPAQRTEWNVRDSDVTLIIGPVADTQSSEVSPGTALTRELASSISRPVRTVEKGDIEDTVEWLRNQGTELTVNIAGPRESEWPGAYEASYRTVSEPLTTLSIHGGSPCAAS